MPELPGLVRTSVGDETIEVVTGNLWRALRRMRSDFRDVIADPQYSAAAVEWWQAPAAVLEARILSARDRMVSLDDGRAIRIAGAVPATPPAAWGLYKIRQAADETWYVGITSNLRVRLAAHRRSGLYDPQAGDEVLLIPARAPGDGAVVIWEDLQRAERAHIAELRRNGCAVRNVHRGGNGRPPDQRFEGTLTPGGRSAFVRRRPRRLRTADWYDVDEDDNRIPGTGRPEVPLGVVLYERDSDWDLWVDQQGYLKAAGKGRGSYTKVGASSTVSGVWLRAEYAAGTGGRNLDEDLSELSWPAVGTGDVPLYYWKPKQPLLNDEGSPLISPAALMGLRPEHVRDRQLPSLLTEQGFDIDPTFGRRNNVNEIVRVTSLNGSAVYIKTERNVAAVRAEVLVSLLWHRLNWPGLAGRVVGDENDLILKIPALGGGGIVDKGNFATHFTWCQPEGPTTLRSPRAFVLKRVTLQDLQLRDPWDALRFLLVNAVTGNSDRHQENIHYGQAAGEQRRAGYLLPVDHGYCVFNNLGRSSSAAISGSPADAVTGVLSNPHQMLRPVAELLDDSYETSIDVAVTFLARLLRVIERVHSDPLWGVSYDSELKALGARCEAVADDLDGFLGRCEATVVR